MWGLALAACAALATATDLTSTANNITTAFAATAVTISNDPWSPVVGDTEGAPPAVAGAPVLPEGLSGRRAHNLVENIRRQLMRDNYDYTNTDNYDETADTSTAPVSARVRAISTTALPQVPVSSKTTKTVARKATTHNIFSATTAGKASASVASQGSRPARTTHRSPHQQVASVALPMFSLGPTQRFRSFDDVYNTEDPALKAGPVFEHKQEISKKDLLYYMDEGQLRRNNNHSPDASLTRRRNKSDYSESEHNSAQDAIDTTTVMTRLSSKRSEYHRENKYRQRSSLYGALSDEQIDKESDKKILQPSGRFENRRDNQENDHYGNNKGHVTISQNNAQRDLSQTYEFNEKNSQQGVYINQYGGPDDNLDNDQNDKENQRQYGNQLNIEQSNQLFAKNENGLLIEERQNDSRDKEPYRRAGQYNNHLTHEEQNYDQYGNNSDQNDQGKRDNRRSSQYDNSPQNGLHINRKEDQHYTQYNQREKHQNYQHQNVRRNSQYNVQHKRQKSIQNVNRKGDLRTNSQYNIKTDEHRLVGEKKTGGLVSQRSAQRRGQNSEKKDNGVRQQNRKYILRNGQQKDQIHYQKVGRYSRQYKVQHSHQLNEHDKIGRRRRNQSIDEAGPLQIRQHVANRGNRRNSQNKGQENEPSTHQDRKNSQLNTQYINQTNVTQTLQGDANNGSQQNIHYENLGGNEYSQHSNKNVDGSRETKARQDEKSGRRSIQYDNQTNPHKRLENNFVKDKIIHESQHEEQQHKRQDDRVEHEKDKHHDDKRDNRQYSQDKGQDNDREGIKQESRRSVGQQNNQDKEQKTNTNVKYKLLKVRAPGGSRRSGGKGSRQFLQERGSDGLTLFSLDDAPFPQFRLPSARRQYMYERTDPRPPLIEQLPKSASHSRRSHSSLHRTH